MIKKFSMCSIMKKMAPVLLASVFLLPLSARAEIKAGSVEVTPFAGYNFFEKRQNLENQPVIGARLGYNITNTFGIEGTWDFIKSYVDDKSIPRTRQGQFASPTNSVFITQYNLDLLYHFMPQSRINPYITAGYGIIHYTPKINNKNLSVLDFGVGAKFWVAEHIALRADVRDNMIFDEHIHNVATTLGVVFAFGGTSKAAPLPLDSDGDG
ncbi:MAG: outer membrane beta-barrel domain-containing protein, partial [Desulfuromonadales bacterium]|nr:outer membrane beta-barrel domain-containing protein [Desulfuromonadales bacterium]